MSGTSGWGVCASVTSSMTLGDESTLSAIYTVTMNIQNGGTLTAGSLLLATVQSSGGNAGTGGGQTTANVTGAGSKINVPGLMTIGRRDPGPSTVSNYNASTNNTGTLNILSGGVVESGYGSATSATVGWGQALDSEGDPGGGRGVGFVTVDGANSRWTIGNETNASNLRISHNDGQGTVTVSDGGKLEVAGNIVIGDRGTLHVASGSVEATDLSWVAGGLLRVTLSDQDTEPLIVLDGLLDPGGADFELDVDPLFSAALNTSFTIATFDSISASTFNTYGEGATVTANGTEFRISYGQDTVDALTLTVIPEPGSALLLLVGSVFLFARPVRTRKHR